jgi:cytochrome b involved in lipid metabolism
MDPALRTQNPKICCSARNIVTLIKMMKHQRKTFKLKMRVVVAVFEMHVIIDVFAITFVTTTIPLTAFVSDRSISNAGYSCTTTTYSFHEVSKHNTEESAWLLVGDDIFDVTEYLARHPGGKESILRKSGGIADCSEDFFFHSKRGRSLWKSCYIGKIRKCYCHPHSTMRRPNEQALHVNLRERLQNFFGGIMARVHSDAVT